MKAIAIIAAVLLAGCSQAVSPVQSAPNAGKVSLLNIDCDTNKNFGQIKGSIRNTGTVPVEYSTPFVDVNGSVVSGYVLPTTIPPGSLAEFSVTSPNGIKAAPCKLVAIQDKDGRNLL